MKKRVGELTFFVLIILIFVIGCENPLVIQLLNPKTASFVTNGGSGIESQIVYRDYPVKRPSNPSKGGYTFDAWYIDNESFLEQWDFNVIPNADVTLYANWISNGGTDPDDDPVDPNAEYSITFVYGNGIENTTQKISDGGKLTAPTPPTRKYTATQGLYLNPVPDNYTLDGWFTDNNTFNNEWDFTNDSVTEDITLYANWTVPNRIEIGGNVNAVETAITIVKGNAAADKSYTLLRSDASIQVYPQTIDVPNFNLTIKGISGSSYIRYNGDATSSLFTINADDAKLTFEGNITLEGKAGSVSLITVTNGTLVMESGSAITGHTNTSSGGGGGVNVNGGTFIMNGGTISGNNAPNGSGGGVYVSSGTFTMNNGQISGNTAIQAGGVYVFGIFKMKYGIISGNKAIVHNGGGVLIGEFGTFTIDISGKVTVYGNDASVEGLKNTAVGQGAALYIDSGGIAQYSNGNNIISGNYTDNTINY